MNFSRVISRSKCLKREETTWWSCLPSTSLLRHFFHATWAVINPIGVVIRKYIIHVFVLGCATCCVPMVIVVPRGSNGFNIGRESLQGSSLSRGTLNRVPRVYWHSALRSRETWQGTFTETRWSLGSRLLPSQLLHCGGAIFESEYQICLIYWKKETFHEFIWKKIELLIITYLQDHH